MVINPLNERTVEKLNELNAISGQQAEQEIRRRLEIFDSLIKHKFIIQEALSDKAENGDPLIERQAQSALYDLRDIW
jgi:hypothetical protein